MFQIMINLVRGKFVALFLGPEGMGISSMFTNISSTISQLSSCGLNLATVKEIASSKESPEKLSRTIAVVKHLFLATAVFGLLICILFAPLFARLSFGSENFSSQFIFIGMAVFFMIDNGGKISILQGLHEIKRLSKSSLVGALSGLIIGVPLYWKFGNAAIAPAIAILALSQNIFYRWQLHASCRNLPKAGIRLVQHKPLIKKLFSLGFILLASDLIGNLCNYLLLAMIRATGNLNDVGFFQSANSITNQIAGVVFTAMSVDYFPRLSAVAADNKEMYEVVNRQSEIVGCLILPLALLLILFAPLVVRILLTSQFYEIIPILRWMALGVVIKAIGFPMGYISFAKDNKRFFFWLEGVVGNILSLITILLFFHWFGLDGFGYGMVVEQSLCFLIYFLVNKKLYDYKFSNKSAQSCVMAVILTSFSLLCSYIPDDGIAYSIIGILTISTIIFCVMRLKRSIMKDS